MDLDLIGGSPRLGKPYSMLERRTLGCDETIANEPENSVNHVQVRILKRTFKIDPRGDSVLPFVPSQLRDRFGSPRFYFSGKAAVLGRFQFEVIEDRLCISLDLAVGGCRLHIKGDDSTSHVHFNVFLDNRTNFRQIDVAGLEVEVEGRHWDQRIALCLKL